MTAAEIHGGIAHAQRSGAHSKAKALKEWWATVEHLYGDRILTLDLAAALQVGNLVALAHALGRNPGFADLAIAGTAQTHGLTVLTRNVRQFEPLSVVAIDPFLGLPTSKTVKWR